MDCWRDGIRFPGRMVEQDTDMVSNVLTQPCKCLSIVDSLHYPNIRLSIKIGHNSRGAKVNKYLNTTKMLKMKTGKVNKPGWISNIFLDPARCNLPSIRDVHGQSLMMYSNSLQTVRKC